MQGALVGDLGDLVFQLPHLAVALGGLAALVHGHAQELAQEVTRLLQAHVLYVDDLGHRLFLFLLGVPAVLHLLHLHDVLLALDDVLVQVVDVGAEVLDLVVQVLHHQLRRPVPPLLRRQPPPLGRHPLQLARELLPLPQPSVHVVLHLGDGLAVEGDFGDALLDRLPLGLGLPLAVLVLLAPCARPHRTHDPSPDPGTHAGLALIPSQHRDLLVLSLQHVVLHPLLGLQRLDP